MSKRKKFFANYSKRVIATTKPDALLVYKCSALFCHVSSVKVIMDGHGAGLICLAIIQFFSFLCALYVLLHCVKNKATIRSLPNHLIICLLVVATWAISIDLFSTEFFYWTGYVLIRTEHACRFYNVSYLSVASLNRNFMAFMSVERHLLVFRHQLYRTRRSRYLFHYFPILLVLLYILVCSLVADVFFTCPALRFRYNRLFCGYTCTILSRDLTLYYIWCQVFVPVLITTVACILLPIRFLVQKHNLQRLEWRRARKMIVQMSVIAGTYTICWIPYTVIAHLGTANVISFNDDTVAAFVNFAPYISSLLTPFICLHTVSERLKFELLKRMIHFCFPRWKNRVNVQTISVAPNQHRATTNAYTAVRKN